MPVSACWEPGDYAKWKRANHTQIASGQRQTCAKDTWGGKFHDESQPQEGDIIIKEPWAQSGFANTDLDHQLKEHGIETIIIIGMWQIPASNRLAVFGMELSYHVTLVKGGTAAYSREAMHAAHEINGPTLAHAILTTSELVAAFPKHENSGATASHSRRTSVGDNATEACMCLGLKHVRQQRGKSRCQISLCSDSGTDLTSAWSQRRTCLDKVDTFS